jgi:hypothetical protein
VSPIAEASTRHSETRVSMTEILDWIDPTALPPGVQTALTEIGPLLVNGLTYREIANRLTPARSEDYVAAKVKLIRQALGEEALRRSDGMRADLRDRIRALSPTSTA